MDVEKPEEVPEAGVNALAVDDEVKRRTERRRLMLWYLLSVRDASTATLDGSNQTPT